MDIILATKNAGKVREMAEILKPYNINVISQKDAGIDVEVLETGSTFEENAEIKARAVAMLCDSPVLADDSGLCIDALGGKPGIYSARYGGETLPYPEKIRCLLKELENATDRSAKFECSMVLVMPDGRKFSATGCVPGSILKSPEGTGGFGYDSIFYSSEISKSFGTASEEEKNSISHRGRALTNLCNELKNKGVID